MKPAKASQGRPFRADEYASMKTVSGLTREDVLADPLHPKLSASRPISCVCGHATIGEHNAAVSEGGRG